MSSREYAKFKRKFIGPEIPKRIKKERGIGYTPAMPAKKPPRCDKQLLKLVEDRRSVRYGLNLKNYVTPVWANKQLIKEIYKEAKRISIETGIKHEVDHIIPLRGELVCGLHVESNLRIITRFDNNQKDNYFLDC